MSAEALRAVANLTISIRPSERLLLSVLASEADEQGFVRSHTQRSLAQRCGWPKIDTVRVVSKCLADRGLLLVLTKGYRSSPATYRLPFVAARASS